MKKNSLILLLLLLFLTSFLRLWKLGHEPIGFYSDEALYGYEAYSLLTTGKDQFGNAYPLSIAGFGDYRPALYIYATLPFISVFGLTEFAVRFPSALFSIATVLVSYLFIKEITKSEKAALGGGLVLAISPWSIYFARMAHETNLMTLLIISAVYILWKFRGSTIGTVTKIVLFTTALYTYHTARIFVPLFLLSTVVLFHKEVWKNRKQLILGLGLFAVLLIPLAREFTHPESWARVKGISIWDNPGLIAKIESERNFALSEGMQPMIAKLTYSKLTAIPAEFIKNYLSHFSADFLLLKGDPNGIYNTPNIGILLWVEPLLILLGAVGLWKKNRTLFIWILGAVAISLVPDSLTRVAPSSARIHIALPFLAVFSGLGLEYIVKPKKMRGVFQQLVRFAPTIMCALLIINIYWFWQNYLYVLPIQNQRAWQIGVKELVRETDKIAQNYERVWMSRECWGWIHVVFHTRYSSQLFQKEAKPTERNEVGFWWVRNFSNYYLDSFPQNYFFNEPNTLYVGLPKEFPVGIEPMKIITHPITKEEMFWLVESKKTSEEKLVPEFDPNEGYL